MDNSKYNVNDCFFETIDTEQKAYILGFIYADGYNSGYRLQITQLVQDADILYQIKESMESDHPITKRLNDAKHEIAVLNMGLLNYLNPKIEDSSSLKTYDLKILNCQFENSQN